MSSQAISRNKKELFVEPKTNETLKLNGRAKFHNGNGKLNLNESSKKLEEKPKSKDQVSRHIKIIKTSGLDLIAFLLHL